MWIHIDAPQLIQINVDPHQRDVILCAVVSYRLQIFYHLKLEVEIMLEGNEFLPLCLSSC